MKRRIPILAALVLFVAAALSPVWADVVVTPKDLADMGIRTRALRLANISHDGKVVVCSEHERDPKVIAKGVVVKLRVFKLGAGKPALTTIVLPTTATDQVATSPDGKSALVVAEKGTCLIGVDLVKGTSHVVFRNKKGEPSFRCQPYLVWFENGKFHTLGYYMDVNQIATGDAIVSIDIAGRGLFAIHKVRDISDVLNANKDHAGMIWFSSQQAYFVGRESRTSMVLSAWFGDKVMAVDKAEVFGALAVGQNRVCYPAHTGKNKVFCVFDGALNKRWTLGTKGLDYAYPYMSEDGKTILASIFPGKYKMSTSYACESDNWTLHPIKGLTDIPMSTMRFAGNGRVVAAYGPRGLALVNLPPPPPAQGKNPPAKSK